MPTGGLMELTPQEVQGAEHLYRIIRGQDGVLASVRMVAARHIEEWTSYAPRDVGSYGLGLNLCASDLDLGIGVPASDHDRVLTVLRAHTTFKGERRTSATSTRFVYLWQCRDVDVDISVLPTEDFEVVCRMLERIRAEMTHEEKVLHVWKKQQLYDAGRSGEYAEWKLGPYRKFCPQFDWVPILDARRG